MQTPTKRPMSRQDRRNSKKGRSDDHARCRGGGMGMRSILFVLASAVLAFLVSKYRAENVAEVVRSKAVETVQTLRKLISSRVGSSGANRELSSSVGKTKSFYVLPNGENDGGKNVTITIGEDLSELERRLSAEIGCGPIVPLEVLPADTPCSIHDGVGHHINDTSSSSVLFKTLPSQVHLHRLYMVPPDRNYMLPTVEVGHVLEIPSTVATGPCGQIRFTTLSLSPKAFLLENLFSKEEGYDVIQSALEMTGAYKLQRSLVVGADEHIKHNGRTCENAYVQETDVSIEIQKRIFNAIGVPYEPTWSEGLQVLHYQQTQGHMEHHDYFDPIDEHDFDSAKQGTNRFATIVMYFNDVESGGSTYFPYSPEVPSGLPSADIMLKNLREGDAKDSGIEHDSWEEKLAVKCQRHLAVQARQGKAVLFYDQFPNGENDETSLHGACPIVKGQKWAANLWVWNGPMIDRAEKDKYGNTVPINEEEPVPISVEFINEGVDNATLFFETDKRWSDMKIGSDIQVTSYVGHSWTAQVNGKIVRKWEVNSPQDTRFVLKAEDLVQSL